MLVALAILILGVMFWAASGDSHLAQIIDEERTGLIVALLVVLLLALSRMLHAILRAPVAIHNEQQESIKSKQQRIDDLEAAASNDSEKATVGDVMEFIKVLEDQCYQVQRTRDEQRFALWQKKLRPKIEVVFRPSFVEEFDDASINNVHTWLSRWNPASLSAESAIRRGCQVREVEEIINDLTTRPMVFAKGRTVVEKQRKRNDWKTKVDELIAFGNGVADKKKRERQECA